MYIQVFKDCGDKVYTFVYTTLKNHYILILVLK